MKSRGFTLIELLAIIVILAIIAVITVPQIANVIEDSRKNSTKDSAYGYKNAVHQYYLNETASGTEIDMNGEYSVENGKVSEAFAGACYNISYFTYDENAEMGSNGTITSKLSSPDENWTYYIKEIEYNGDYSYYINLINDSLIESLDDPEELSAVYELPSLQFYSLDSCQEFLASKSFFSSNFECIRDKSKLYYICGVYGGENFCLKSGEDSYEYNVDTFNNLFDDCNDSYGLHCGNNFIELYDYNINVGRCRNVSNYPYGLLSNYDFKNNAAVCTNFIGNYEY